MTHYSLDSLTDAELSEIFAVEIAGWKHWPPFAGQAVDSLWPDEAIHAMVKDLMIPPDGNLVVDGKLVQPPPFATSADAVLPWLEKWHQPPQITRVRHFANRGWRWHVDINVMATGIDESSARAAATALILAARKGRVA